MRSKSKLPPCKDLLLHIRINHCIAHFKRTDQPSFWHPNSTDPEQGWERTKKWIRTKWIWSCRPALPSSLVTLVETKTAEEIDEDDPDLEIDLCIYFMTTWSVQWGHHVLVCIIHSLCVFLLLSYWDPLYKVSFSFVWISIRHMFNPIAYVKCLYFFQWYWFFWWN